MAATRTTEPVVRFCAIITRHEDAYRWARDRLARSWGDAVLIAPAVNFCAGGYYEADMGGDLKKRLVAFGECQPPDGLPEWKHETNRLEQDYAARCDHPETRPINLDCGYVTQAKLILATTKDREHRIYLRDAMFAEITLTYTGGRWTNHYWTYPSYRTDVVAQFAQDCRELLREHLRATDGFRRAGDG